MGANKDKIKASLNKIVTQIKLDGNWTYSQQSKQTFAAERKADRSFNCAHGLCFVLKDAGLMPQNGWFYFAFNRIHFSNKEVEKEIRKNFDIIHTDKLKKYDFVGFKNLSHSTMYLGDNLFADFGTKANVRDGSREYKRNIIDDHKYGKYKPSIVLRLKKQYYPKYSGKEKESIVRALKELGINSSFSHRKKIAKYNKIKDYAGTEEQNLQLLKLLKKGKLIK